MKEVINMKLYQISDVGTDYIHSNDIHEIAAKKGISVPIVDAVYAVIYENQNPRKMAESLMSRSLKAE